MNTLSHNILQSLFSDNKNSSDFFRIFAFIWGIYVIFHFIYLIYYSPALVPSPITLSWVNVGLAFLVVLNTHSKPLFLVLVASQLTELWLLMPFASNHSIIQFFFGLIFIATAAKSLLSDKTLNQWDISFAQGGRYLLIIMYIFGIFHKINAGFLNPETSCAVALWQTYMFPELIKDALWAHYSAIYATFIIEGGVLLGLLFHKTRYWAMVIGIAFHLFLAFSSFAFYPTFSLLSVALHFLFLPPGTLKRFKASSTYERLKPIRENFAVFLVLYSGMLYYAAKHDSLILLIILFCFIGFPTLLFAYLFGREKLTTRSNYVWPPQIMPTFIAMLFFINCAMPYAGLKTQQTLNMFSNLHLENGRSNHLIFKNAPTLFDYLEGSVKITRYSLKSHPEASLALPPYEPVYHDLLAALKDNPNLTASYIQNGKAYENMSSIELKEDIDKIVMPKLVRKLFHFTGVDNRQPKPCK